MPPDSDPGDHLILLGINDADVRRTCIDHVDFVAFRIRCHPGWFRADGQRAYGRKRPQVDDGNVVALAVRNVRILAVERTVGGQGTLVEVVPTRSQHKRDAYGDK